MIIPKLKDMKGKTFRNIKNEKGRSIFEELINGSRIRYLFDDINGSLTDEYNHLRISIDSMINKSFKKRSPNNKKVCGIAENIKELMKYERWIKINIKSNPERGRLLYEVQKEITEKINLNLRTEMSKKVNSLIEAKNPQSEVFKIRRNYSKREKIGFPLRDKDGKKRTNISEINTVIQNHFHNVFKQNAIPTNGVWRKYWYHIDNIFALLKEKALRDTRIEYPSFNEISKIIDNLGCNKAVYGRLNNDLIKLGGDTMKIVIYKFICKCHLKLEIPDEFKSEKITLLYKQKGAMDDLNNYRGIFLRLAILVIYQKWLYSKCAPKIDANGSVYAYGGRKGKSCKQALLIIKLIQDNVKWCKSKVIIKFLDIEKFYDSMNFRKALIEAYLSGLNGRYWSAYELLNRKKKCIPTTPIGICDEIEIEEILFKAQVMPV